MTRLVMDPNLAAFLDTIAFSEGTDNGKQPTSNSGYDVIVGGSLFTDYADHPRKLVQINPRLASTAAGRYQLLARYFDPYKAQLNLPDFSPESQDAIALQQIKECRAIDLIKGGRLEAAIARCARIWASLPGAGYNQHENKLGTLVSAFTRAGGTLEA